MRVAMPHFSKISTDRLNTLDARLREILVEAIRWYDFSIICGHRDKAEQEEAFNNGKTQLNWPDSRHNVFPSLAVDIAPYPLDWKDTDEFCFLQGVIFAIAQKKGTKIRQGFRWSFGDYPHVELES